ncbi:alanine/glycine:cation symporter family protein [Qaidamihabitans albus]|uniref:alanine/glycine:cation symporter family protein n=1 Tax=Qaidamihabitans albus TaxID=2795733 RepID=UPI0018F1B006|nr:alanine/glycine:cation symporter family protein [Qaidamihabitans albus]
MRSIATRLLAQEEEGAKTELLARVEQAINDLFDPVAEWLSDFVFAEISVFGVEFPWIVSWLVLAGFVFTIYFGFIQFRGFKLATKVLRGKYTKDDEPGEISHFQALSAAVSGTVGLGNIAGVGVAVTIGGAGATFWMIIAGFLGMCTKFVECTLGVRYREEHPDGTVSGGPMHYLRKGIAERLPGNAGKVIGTLLAILASVMILAFSFGGNMFQANQAVAQIENVTGGDDSFLATDGARLIAGIVIGTVIGVVIFGGIKSIGAVTSRLVPAMAAVYVCAGLIVIIVNITSVPGAFRQIVDGAFTGQGVLGGVIGALIVGFTRAAYSNEAGLGSAPIAHSAVRTRHPSTEGLVAMLEPFIDTVIICTMTALIIITANTAIWREGQQMVLETGDRAGAPDGVTVTSQSFETVLPWFPYVLAVAVVLFAVSTMITWAYYGEKAWIYLVGRSKTKESVYRVAFCLILVVGSVLALDSVLSFVDATLFLLALFNILGLYVLAPVVKRELRSFRSGVRSGEIEEVKR